jgi:hypothetical protein
MNNRPGWGIIQRELKFTTQLSGIIRECHFLLYLNKLIELPYDTSWLVP